ncbi:MoaD/ThiS family protein [Sphingomonas colocasiae]|uniref:MoaD/ThiS family protein n=1 Tax=Sphingomonas colocasiae TaxID=1848973 RepID=A0ABS7PJE5_9SPHN|nr:MoaD/ThiS family protein [Sphingomonas colocasiae]MBY8820875.1 MoaD/ThiS family protein [Sphingomonas colocasiae]
MAIDFVYFAWVREAIGHDAERLDPPADALTVAAVIDWLSGLSDGHKRAFFDRSRIRAAIDQVFAPLDAPVAGAREIAFFPPVTGG